MATTVYLAPIGNGAQFLGTSLVLLNGGQLITYAAGTTTSTSTFTTSSGAVANTNPIVLGSDGRPPQEIWLTGGQAYKFVLQDSASTTIGTYDNLYGIGDPFATNASQPVLAYGITGANAIAGTVPTGYTFASSSPNIIFTPVSTNTSSVTVNFTPLGQAAIGAKSILAGNTALLGGELHANIPVALRPDGSAYQLMGPVFKQPTRVVITGGSGTWTTPIGATRINVRLVGGGGGGGAQVTNNGTNGGDTTFGTLTAGGGVGGAAASTANVAGGTASGGDINLNGSAGGVSPANGGTAIPGGAGGVSAFGGGGTSASNGTGGGGQANTGSGGAGGGAPASTPSGAGGGSGAYCEKLFVGPAVSYVYAVGTAGTGGVAGTLAGGNGGAGIIIIDISYD